MVKSNEHWVYDALGFCFVAVIPITAGVLFVLLIASASSDQKRNNLWKEAVELGHAEEIETSAGKGFRWIKKIGEQ